MEGGDGGRRAVLYFVFSLSCCCCLVFGRPEPPSLFADSWSWLVAVETSPGAGPTFKTSSLRCRLQGSQILQLQDGFTLASRSFKSCFFL